MTLPNELIRHLSRVYDDIVASSYPQTFEEVCGHYDAACEYGLGDGAGWSFALAFDPRARHRASVSVAVETADRGLGFGSLALQRAEVRAKQNGFAWLDGWLWEDNTAALAMDMRFGFGIVGRIADAWRYPDGTPRHMLLVTKRIG